MVKNTAFLIALLAFAIPTFSQVEVGIKGGLNYVNMNVKNDFLSPNNQISFLDDNRYRLGYHAGVFSTLRIAEKFSVSPELLYSNKGFKMDERANDDIYHFNYLNLPVMFGYEAINKLTLEAGIELGYLISNTIKTDSSDTKMSSDFIEKKDFALAAGIKYKITENFSVNARYSHSFYSAFPHSTITFTDLFGQHAGTGQVKYRNRTFQFSLAYRLAKFQVVPKTSL